MAFATIDDVETALGRPLTDEEKQRARSSIEEASVLIRLSRL